MIQPNMTKILSGSVRHSQITQTNRFGQWLGYAFERLCQRNAHLIAEHLRFSGIAFESGMWFRRANVGSNSGAQVDLAFVRADKMISACEMKYVDKQEPKKWAKEMETQKSAMLAAFPGDGIESVLILGKGEAGSCAPWFDHVITAETLF